MHSLVAKCVSLYKIMFVNIKSGYNNYCAVDIYFRFQAGYRNLASFLRRRISHQMCDSTLKAYGSSRSIDPVAKYTAGVYTDFALC